MTPFAIPIQYTHDMRYIHAVNLEFQKYHTVDYLFNSVVYIAWLCLNKKQKKIQKINDEWLDCNNNNLSCIDQYLFLLTKGFYTLENYTYNKSPCIVK